MELKSTPLLEEHKRLGAQVGPFGGWLMPIQYSGIISEHNWTRKNASLFDICHMGEFIISGTPQETDLERIVTINLKSMPQGRCRYGFMLNANGGIIDDIVVYKIREDKFMMVVNAAKIDADESNLRKYLKDAKALENVSCGLGKLDLQGPLSAAIIEDVLKLKVSVLKYYSFASFDVLGEKNIISRTGYTGELGFELYLSNKKIKELWGLLLKDERLKPAGLGARDTLRLEMAYPLNGQDIDDNITPFEASLDKFVDYTKDFIGKDALLNQKKSGKSKEMVYFIADSRRAPRHNYRIYLQGKDIGFVTSGTFSPSLSFGIGMGYANEGLVEGQDIILKDQNVEISAKVTGKPFYKNGTYNKEI